MGYDLADALVEVVARHHDDVAAPHAHDLDIRAEAHDLKESSSGRARMLFLHFDNVEKMIIWYLHS